MIPVNEDRPKIRKLFLRLPWYSLSISIVYCVLYSVYPYRSSTFRQLAFDTEFPQEAYRWYTYSLMHLNAAHISMNVLMTFIFGALIEWDNFAIRCFGIHTASIIGGAFGCGWEHRFTGKNIMLVGASGGAYGLLASQMGNLIVNWPELGFERRLIFTSLLVCTTLSDVIVSIVCYNPMVSYSTHVGGFITGAIAGNCMMKNWKKLEWEKWYRIACWIALACYLAAGMTNILID